MKTQKIIIKRKNGHYTVKGNGDRYLWQLARGAMERGEMQPTFTQKVRRFFCRLGWTVNAQIDKTITIAALPEMVSAEPPEFYIGLEDWVR